MGVHFTVRLAMAKGRNKCSTLKNWRTEMPEIGTAQWLLGERTLKEDDLKPDTAYPDDEYKILRG